MLENSLLKKPTETCIKSRFFHLFFLKNNEDYDVEVEEVEEIDFTKIIERLERGESVFISPKRKQESSRKKFVEEFPKENAAEPWYFTHI
ncbi:hypothetical protein KEJ45_02990 [Candidatus Bathyarchaeota archaeon]|nr:hypothetical protein [Candidatus Bathyarchaeota archaeon]